MRKTHCNRWRWQSIDHPHSDRESRETGNTIAQGKQGRSRILIESRDICRDLVIDTYLAKSTCSRARICDDEFAQITGIPDTSSRIPPISAVTYLSDCPWSFSIIQYYPESVLASSSFTDWIEKFTKKLGASDKKEKCMYIDVAEGIPRCKNTHDAKFEIYCSSTIHM